MKKHSFHVSKELNAQKAVRSRRALKRIMMKLYKTSKAHPCNEFDFDRCLSNYHVIHHLDELLGIVDCTDEKFYHHHGNQPVIYFGMSCEPENGIHWNGILHYTSSDIDATRSYIQKHREDYHVVAAFEDLFTGLYHFMVDTHATDLSDDNFRLVRKHYTRILKDDVKDLQVRHYNFYVRVMPEEKFDIIDRDALFGEPVPYQSADVAVVKTSTVETPANAPVVDAGVRSCKTMSLGEIISKYFGHLFNH